MSTPVLLKRLMPGRFLKRLVPSRLLGRLLLIVVMPLVILIGISSFIFYERHWDTVARQLALGLAGDIMMLVALQTVYPDDQTTIWRMAQSGMQLQVSLEPGGRLDDRPLSEEERAFLDGPFGLALQERVVHPFRIEEVERDVRLSVQVADGVLHVVSPRKRVFSSTTYIFIIWMIGVSLLVSALAIVFVRNQVRPIRHLAAATRLFGKGRDVPGFKPEGAAEVRQAGQAFVLMRERIRRQIEQRTEMLAGVSHDLRTPLTRMKLQLALMQEGEDIEALQEDVNEMERMIEGYLAFARGEGSESIQMVNLTALLTTLASRVRRQGGAIDLHVEREILLPVRANAMERCLSNLISNAVRYAGHVAVRVSQRGESIDILIDDDGPGIPPDKREEVFRAFYRLEISRNPATGGVGLGLTIARDIARGHGGDVLLEGSPLGGLRAQVRLPV
ncbi:MAG: two-component system OmpR family osmolarity sensor histidine kinase EnvZ [Rhodospirillaceae bacterium]|nr:MAG: two-component system OmpR family osmolarity sensor histidine kinase EnvZ [Rhodospirillaceae bacterium]